LTFGHVCTYSQLPEMEPRPESFRRDVSKSICILLH
jgi:hypothetical protein